MNESNPLLTNYTNYTNSNFGSSDNNQISKLKKDVDEVIDITRNNLTKAIDRDIKIEELLVKSEDLESGALSFRNHSKKLKWKMCRKNAKFLTIIVLILITICVIIIIVASKKKK